MKKISIILFCLLGVFKGFSYDTGQQIFMPNVRSLTVSKPDNFMGVPIIRLGSNESLNINFDIIGDQHEYLRYRLIHCNADWQPSRLLDSEFIRGFNEGTVEDYAYSSNTYVHYVNYNISLPDPQMPIRASGNYLIQVFPEDDPDLVLLQARFSVSEDLSLIKGGMTSRTDKGFNTEFQQLFFNVDLSSLNSINPYQDLVIEITQNNRPQTSRLMTHPLRVESGMAVFEHDPALIFEAANEFRRFETVRTDYPGMHTDSVKYINGMWNAWLTPDESRKYKNYSFDSTQHGRFKIDEYNATDPDLAADYILVHFSLDPGERQNGKIYIDGDFTSHIFDEENLMKYDWNDGLYHASIPLKQGSYNYQYVVLKDGALGSSVKDIEGNKYETQNEYLVKVFVRTPGSRADRLVGFTIL